MLETGTKVFGEWLIDEKIGSGAFGTVYKIKREEFGAVYYAALKVINIPQDPQDQLRLRSEGMDDESITTYYGQVAQNFIQEIKLLSTLDGVTNIVDYKDHSIVPNDSFGYTIYIKMQLLKPLSKLLVDENNNALFLSQPEILNVGIDMCSALELCEKQKIIHRDIKVDNIFVSSNGDYKLGDFGIAKQLEATHGEMSKKGTMMYMAPEVFNGENYNNTADIYSLGIVLYRLLNKNRAPFFPDYPIPIKFSDKEKANMKRLGGDVALPAIPGVSEELMAILRKACAFKPAYRFKSAAEFKAALIEVKDHGTFNYNQVTSNNVVKQAQPGSSRANLTKQNNAQPRIVSTNTHSSQNTLYKRNDDHLIAGSRNNLSVETRQQKPVTNTFENQPLVKPNVKGVASDETIGAFSEMPMPSKKQQNNIKPAMQKKVNSPVNNMSQTDDSGDELDQTIGAFSGKPMPSKKQQTNIKPAMQKKVNSPVNNMSQTDEGRDELDQTIGAFSGMPMPSNKQQKNIKPAMQRKVNSPVNNMSQADDGRDELDQTIGAFSDLPSTQKNTTNITQKKKSSTGKIIAIIFAVLSFLGISSTVVIAAIAILLGSGGY